MSKYVKELMMDQLKSDLDGSRSVLILDLKGLDAVSEHQLRSDLRKKSIKIRALKNTLARRVFTDMGMDGLSQYLDGPCVAVWGGDGVAELAKEISARSRRSRSPRSRGGPSTASSSARPGRGHHQAAQPRGPDRPRGRPGPGPGAAGRLAGQRPGRRPDEPAQDAVRRAPEATPPPKARRRRRPPPRRAERCERPTPAPARIDRIPVAAAGSAPLRFPRSLRTSRPTRLRDRRKGPDDPWPPPKPRRSPTTSRAWATRSSS